jgi:Holliday junction resolvase RusA-like endonuclease
MISNHFLLDIKCVPIAKPRPRFGRFGVYNTDKSVEFEEMLAREFLGVVGRPDCRLIREISICSFFSMPMPASWSKKRKNQELGKAHTQRPDVDNLQKHVFDAMKKAELFVDDSVIAAEYSEKRWALEGGIHIGFFAGEASRRDMLRHIELWWSKNG